MKEGTNRIIFEIKQMNKKKKKKIKKRKKKKNYYKKVLKSKRGEREER